MISTHLVKFVASIRNEISETRNGDTVGGAPCHVSEIELFSAWPIDIRHIRNEKKGHVAHSHISWRSPS